MAQALDLLTANDRRGEYPPSLYAAETALPTAMPALEGSARADVAIIGAGFTGLSAALHLAERGYDVAVLDAQRAGWGASGRNGGQVGSGQRVDQEQLEARHGLQTAKRLWEIGEESKNLVRELIARHGIECQPAQGIIHADHRAKEVAHSHAYADRLHDVYGYEHVRKLDRDELRSMVNSPAYHGGSIDTDAFSLQPLAYALGLARAAEKAGVRIYEQSRVREVVRGTGVTLKTRKGEITADHVIVACNGYLGDLVPEVAARVMPINNFIIATEKLGERQAAEVMNTEAAVADSKFVINYFRMSHDRRMVFGGGENYGYRFPADIKRFVQKPMLEIFPQLKDTRVEYGWGGTLAITMKRMPFFSRTGANILTCSGYSGQGVGMATLAGKLAAEAIAGQSEKFDVMASLPTPGFPGGSRLRQPLLVLAMSWYALRDRL